MKKILFSFFMFLIFTIFVLELFFIDKKISMELFDAQLWVTDYYSSQNGKLQLT